MIFEENVMIHIKNFLWMLLFVAIQFVGFSLVFGVDLSNYEINWVTYGGNVMIFMGASFLIFHKWNKWK